MRKWPLKIEPKPSLCVPESASAHTDKMSTRECVKHGVSVGMIENKKRIPKMNASAPHNKL